MKYEFRGSIEQFGRKNKTGEGIVGLLVKNISDETISDLFKKDVRVVISEDKPKRSMQANEYMWILTEQLAAKHNISKDEMHKIHMQRYGFILLKADGTPKIHQEENPFDIDLMGGYWRYYDDRDVVYFDENRIHTVHVWYYMMIRGSSTYDAREMSYLLDRIIEECEEEGIPTATPSEVLKMKALYDAKLRRTLKR